MKHNVHPKLVNVTGHRIRQARLKRGVLQMELVEMLARRGVTLNQAAISRIESRQRGVMDRELAAIAQCLKVSIAWLHGERPGK